MATWMENLLMNQDYTYKDAFNEAYYNAIEDGKSKEDAEKIADNAVIEFEANLIDMAKDAWKYRDM